MTTRKVPFNIVLISNIIFTRSTLLIDIIISASAWLWVLLLTSKHVHPNSGPYSTSSVESESESESEQFTGDTSIDIHSTGPTIAKTSL